MKTLSNVVLMCLWVMQSHCICAQALTGLVIDKTTDLPIPFVNIGIVGKTIGTVSDERGRFELELKETLADDVLRFSMVGYTPYDTLMKDIDPKGQGLLIYLQERIFEIEEVTISSNRLKHYTLGVPRKKCFPIPLYKKVTSNLPFPQPAYRHEIGTLFKNDRLTLIDSVRLNFSESKIDSLDLRINIYERREGHFVNVLQKPIYIQDTDFRNNLSPILDLSHLNIFLESDFLIAIENYKELDDGASRILANFKAKGKKYPTYYRSSTHSNWVNLKKSGKKDFGLSLVAFVRQ